MVKEKANGDVPQSVCETCCDLHPCKQFLVLIMYLMSPAMIGLGIAYIILTLSPPRYTLIANYNRYVQNWTSNLAPFEATIFDYSGMSFTVDRSPEYINDSDPTILTYTSYRLHIASIPINTSESTISFFANYNYSTTSSEVFLDTVKLVDYVTILKVQLGCSDDITCGTACIAQNGVWDSTAAVCNAVQYINALCFKLMLYNGLWFADTVIGGGNGCYYDSKAAFNDTGNFDLELNPFTPALYGPTLMDEVPLTLRVGQDPYIYLSWQSMGTYYFGDPMTTERNAGYVLVAIGGFWAIVVTVGLIMYIRWSLEYGRKSSTVIIEGFEQEHHPHKTCCAPYRRRKNMEMESQKKAPESPKQQKDNIEEQKQDQDQANPVQKDNSEEPLAKDHEKEQGKHHKHERNHSHEKIHIIPIYPLPHAE